jgi:hypothetical protein
MFHMILLQVCPVFAVPSKEKERNKERKESHPRYQERKQHLPQILNVSSRLYRWYYGNK